MRQRSCELLNLCFSVIQCLKRLLSTICLRERLMMHERKNDSILWGSVVATKTVDDDR